MTNDNPISQFAADNAAECRFSGNGDVSISKVGGSQRAVAAAQSMLSCTAAGLAINGIGAGAAAAAATYVTFGAEAMPLVAGASAIISGLAPFFNGSGNKGDRSLS